MTRRERHVFKAGPDPLRCAVCGWPRFSSTTGPDANHKRDPKGTCYGRATR